MATSTRQADRLRTTLRVLTNRADIDVRRAWGRFDTAEQAKAELTVLLDRLARTYGVAAATLAADWYDDLRAELGVQGRFRAIPAQLPADVGAAELAGWGVGPLFQAVPDVAAAQSLVTGGLQRRITNAARDTITGSTYADPRARGWQRVGGGACAFCAMLIGRGAVYSEAGADFASHDHCNCSAVPAFDGQPVPVKPFTPSLRSSSDADRARVRDYLRANPQ